MAYKLQKQPTLKRQEKLNKKNKLLKRVTFTFIIATIVLLLWVFLFRNRVSFKKYDGKYLKLSYDSTWTLSKSSDDYLAFTHKSNSLVTIKVLGLTSKNHNSDIGVIADEVRYDIEHDNNSYKLLKQESGYISSKRYEAYKYLYEDGSSQAMIVIVKNENNIYVINYTSSNETFDIVLDSFQYILGSIDLK